jgi:hypothetical protein
MEKPMPGEIAAVLLLSPYSRLAMMFYLGQPAEETPLFMRLIVRNDVGASVVFSTSNFAGLT